MVDTHLRPAAFIDRDGVINRELHHVHRIEDFHVLPGVVPGLRSLATAGYALVVVTNQGGIAKGLYGPEQFEALTRHMLEHFAVQGIEFAGVYHCPHHPQGAVAPWAVPCACRKPEPGLLLRAADELGLDLERSVMVGDKVSDVEAARRAGVGRLVLVESGHALPADTAGVAHHRCSGLAEAAQWVLEADANPTTHPRYVAERTAVPACTP
jgi:D-glycero-D-manno-heptose 1,7-bisphosphate phosphatase